MKTTIRIEKEVDIKCVHMDLDVRYEEEDMPNDYPHRHNNCWCIDVDVDSGQIKNWPTGVPARDIYMKVVDCGSYFLFDDKGNAVGEITGDYVPHGLVPGKYGDYIDFKISENGLITNWPKRPTFSEFFPD